MRNPNNSSIFYNIDWFTVLLYLVLILIGWANIYAAVYNEEHHAITDITQKYGKQMLWIGTAILLALIILIIDESFYTAFAYVIFGALLLANIAVPFIGREIKGSRSWFGVGGFGIQPAEFMKFAANLAIAKFLSNQNIKIADYRNTIISLLILGIPMIIIMKLQNETGLAIVFVAFIFTLYREGLSINYLVIGLFVTILFVLALLVNNLYIYIAIIAISLIAMLFYKRTLKNILIGLLIALLACGIVAGTRYVYDHLPEHQKVRIGVLFGIINVDKKKEGYNVNQAKIAIGSGGFLGKGYLQGTQTKYDFVPEQDTDFIFCTVGEEWGFVGSAFVIILELTLIIRVVFMSERQRSPFSRIYGYGVASVLFFHLTVNIGMTIGLAPVIGIPLPFFSYGGSSLWSFTILLFIFIKLDSHRLQILR
ncbi:MAG: rodA [Bacteroidetes bacterium]|nr:rodA [Bacteroidota bacterium]